MSSLDAVTQPAHRVATVQSIEQECPYRSYPLGIFQQITQNRPDTLLLESANVDSKDDLKSVLLTHAAMRIECSGTSVTFVALTHNAHPLLSQLESVFVSKVTQKSNSTLSIQLNRYHADLDEDTRLKVVSPLDGLRFFLADWAQGQAGTTPLHICGVLAYDLIGTFEPLPAVDSGFNDCPDYVFYVAETLLLMDHQQRTARIVSYLFDVDENKNLRWALTQRNQQLSEICDATSVDQPLGVAVSADVTTDTSDDEYCDVVTTLQSHIEAGDIFQVVPSRGFYLPCPDPLNAYRALKQTNPSPYMFYMRTADFVLFGASPESALKYSAHTRQVEIYPIAGTRRRGRDSTGKLNHDLDSRIELELRQDAKELAEHMMLVDLARNDIARICEPGSRRVPELLKVDRYSHVMHLVSRVTGQLKAGLDALHAYQACMNMGTLVGAPKVRAAQLIREVEQKRRGSYGGAVGYFTSQGDMDTCIVIRSAFVKNNLACIQAGAGVVFDSDPQSEADETRGKAQAVINAIQNGGGR